MTTKLWLGAGLCLALAMPAMAATTGTTGAGSEAMQGANQGQASQQGASAEAPTPQIARHLRENLQSAGFTDIHILPRSFLVQAKDRDGNPVMMIINPHSMEAITALGTAPGTAGSGNGAAGGNGNAMASGNGGGMGHGGGSGMAGNGGGSGMAGSGGAQGQAASAGHQGTTRE